MNVSDGQAREEYVSKDSREPDLGLRVHRGDSDDAGVDAAPRTGVIQPWQTMTAREQWEMICGMSDTSVN